MFYVAMKVLFFLICYAPLKKGILAFVLHIVDKQHIGYNIQYIFKCYQYFFFFVEIYHTVFHKTFTNLSYI